MSTTRKVAAKYRAVRSAGVACIVGQNALVSLEIARTLVLWEQLEDTGLVRLRTVPDDSYDWSDKPDGMSDERWEEVSQGGAWGIVGEYRITEEAEWQQADSVWGFVGYSTHDDPFENPYVSDIMAQTIEQLKDTLKNRCPCCRQSLPHKH